MKKIAIISEHASPLAVAGGVDSGGQNVYVAHVARELARAGLQVDVFTRKDNRELEPEHACATIEAKINYFKPVQRGSIACTSELIHRSKNIASLEAQILVEGEVVARGFGTFSVFRRRSAGAA